MAEYEIMVCPACMEQIHFADYEEPPGHYHDGYAGVIVPVTIPASALAKKLSEAVKAAQPKLEEQRQEEAERVRKREEWEALPEEERERIRAERWAAMSPMEKAMYQAFGLAEADLRDQLGRQAYGGFAKIPVQPKE